MNYGAQNVFGTGSEKELLALKLSPDGQYVIGGKVGLFAWSTQTGQRQQLTTPGPEMARSPVSSIEFLNQSSRFLVSWKDRIDRFDLGRSDSERFNTQQVAYSKNEPNLFGATEVAGRTLVLVRSTSKSSRNSGIRLIDLDSQKTIKTFESARFASFAQSGSGDVIVVNKSNQKSDAAASKRTVLGQTTSTSTIQKWNASTRRLEPVQVSDTLRDQFDGRFSTIQKSILGRWQNHFASLKSKPQQFIPTRLEYRFDQF